MEPTGPTDNPTANPTPAKPKRSYVRKVPPSPKMTLTPRVKEAPPVKRSAMITYIPQDPSDPPMQEFAGIRFKANVPVEVPMSKTVEQLLSEKYQAEGGEWRRRSREHQVPVAVVLAGNPWFEIDGKRCQRIKAHARLPEDADQYRGYCISWIATSMSADSMDKRWVGEEGLRQRCGVAPNDIAHLRPFFEARRLECAELDKTRAA